MAKHKRRNRQQQNPDQQQLRAAFMGCGRCSFFLAALLPQLPIAELVRSQQGNWLKLPLSDWLRSLLERSYDCILYDDTVHYEGSCVDCTRAYVIKQVDGDGRIKIQVMPQNRRHRDQTPAGAPPQTE